MIGTRMIAAGALLMALLLAPVAHADDGSWVCQALAQGYSVPQIVEAIEGDPRVSRLQIENALWDVVNRECGPTAPY